MEINIMDYVSEREIKEAILDSVKEKVYDMREEDIERIYTNACYEAVTKVTNEVIEEKGLEFSIENQVKEIISDLSTYTVFRSDEYRTSPSKAYLLTQKIVEEEKELLREKIIQAMDRAYTEHTAEIDIAQMMSDYVYEIFSTKGDK